MTDIEADGVGSETLALRKELGSGSDVTGSARCWNRFMVKCEILTKGLGLALVGDGQIELHVYGGMTDIEADGVGSETLALRKELGSGSDVTGSARCWNRFMGMSMHMIRLWREFLFNSDGECAIQFQDYSEEIVVSMVILEFQDTGPR
ncbi:Pleckstrin-likey Domain-Containing Family A Member 4 [Manis pentadactyla]|nr:Pleckstrin-likey Domain-Containing Family A Member 4 [Manis pentadactyla]